MLPAFLVESSVEVGKLHLQFLYIERLLEYRAVMSLRYSLLGLLFATGVVTLCVSSFNLSDNADESIHDIGGTLLLNSHHSFSDSRHNVIDEILLHINDLW